MKTTTKILKGIFGMAMSQAPALPTLPSIAGQARRFSMRGHARCFVRLMVLMTLGTIFTFHKGALTMLQVQRKGMSGRITVQSITALVGAFLVCWTCLSVQMAQAQQQPVLLQTTVAANGDRELSPLETFDVTYPDGVMETREFKYSTPSNFATYAANTVNLWLVFHGGGGNTNTMNRYFDIIPDSAPTVLVFPEATLSRGGSTVWRGVVLPGDETLIDPYRDVNFIEQLVVSLLSANPQLHPGKVYASGFSSGGNMTWMLLCYRSKMFQGFAMFSQQLGKAKRDGGCGNGRIQDPMTLLWTIPTGYETLTGARPDRYGYNASLPSGKQKNKTKAVFYAHGTYDDNLQFSNPADSMDPGGPNEDRDDISTKDWLLARHDLLDTNPAGTILPDEDTDPLTDDAVETTSRTYDTSLGTPGVTSRKEVRWLEIVAGIHALSALDHEGDQCSSYPPGGGSSDCNTNPNASKDYETSTQAKEFLETYGGMLQ